MNYKSLIKKIILFVIFFFIITLISFANTVNVKRLKTSGPVIDGDMDKVWEEVQWESIDKIIYGNKSNKNDLYGRYKVLFDENFIYLLIQTRDDLKESKYENYLYNDSVSLFFDFGNEKSEQWDSNDYQFSFSYNQDTIYTRIYGHDKDIYHKWADTENGYILEVRIPVDDKKGQNDLIGFDIIINDVDSNYANCIAAWSGDESDYYSASQLGNLNLADETLIKINFGNKYTKSVDGYFSDKGQEYGVKSNGYIYGWDTNAKESAGDFIKQKEFLIDSFISIDKDNCWKIKLEDGYYKIALSLNDMLVNHFNTKDVFINDKQYFYNEYLTAPSPYQYKNKSDLFDKYVFKKIKMNNRYITDSHLVIEDYIRINPDNPLLAIKKGAEGQARLNYLHIKKIDQVISRFYFPEEDTYISGYYKDKYKSFGNENQILIKNNQYIHGNEKIGLFEFNLNNYSEPENVFFKVYIRNSLFHSPSRMKTCLKLFALKGYEFDETKLTWNNCDLIDRLKWNKASLIDEVVYLGEQDISGKNNIFVSFNIKDYLLDNSSGKFTFIIMLKRGVNESVRLFSKEMGFNSPVIEIQESKQVAVFEGFVTKDENEKYVLQTIQGGEYYLESHLYDLNKYLELKVRITGYFIAGDHNITNNIKTIIVEKIDVFPPEKAILYADYWNNDGFPGWTWDTPDGADFYQYKLNESAWVETENQSFIPQVELDEGYYTLYVQCKNEFSDWSDTASTDVVVDKTKPHIEEIICISPTNNRNSQIYWEAMDNCTATEDLFYEYRIDNIITGSGTDNRYQPEIPLDEGWHIFSVRARDLAGNWSQYTEKTFYIDTTPPRIDNIQVHYVDNDSQACYVWNASDDYSTLLSYEYSLNNTDWVSTDENKCIITTDSFDFFIVKARDEAGNWSEPCQYSALANGLDIIHKDGAELMIPPGSSEELIFIDIESHEIDDTFDDHQVSLQSKIFHLSSDPADIQFGKECELKIEYKEKGYDESKLRIFRFNENTQQWEPQDTLLINTEENYIITRINHFSDYAVGMYYFRVGYTEANGVKKWCFLDQTGSPFYSTGVNTVNGTGHQVIREDIADYPENYPWDEEDNEPEYYPDYYQYIAALIEKFGPEEWQSEWFTETKQRLTDWNFNTLGAFGSYRKENSLTGRFDLPLVEDFSMPYVMMLHIAKNENGEKYEDVFSAEFDEELETQVNKAIIPERVIDPNLIGYYYVGEYDFGPIGYDAYGPTISDMFYEYFELSEDRAGKHALIEFLKDFYDNDIERFKFEFGLYFTHSGLLSFDSEDSYPDIRSFDDLLRLKATYDLQLALNDKENYIFILPIMLTPEDLMPDMKSIFDDVLFKYDAIINLDWDEIDQFNSGLSENYIGLKNLYLSIENLFQDYPEVKAVLDDVIFSDSAENIVNLLDELDQRIFDTIKNIDQILNESQIEPLKTLKGYLEQMQSFVNNLFDLKTVFNEITDVYNEWTEVFKYPDVRKEWMKFTAETYFKKCQQAIKEKDVNHLILGTEFIAWVTPIEVVKIISKYTDVVSVNFYNLAQGLPEDNPLKVLVNYVSDACDVIRFNNLEEFYNYSGKPVMIGEFSFVSDDNLSGCPNSQYRPLPKAETQTERAEMFEIEVSDFIDRPYMIGYHWFEYVDQPPEGRGNDGEDFNVGIVSINDEIYEELTAKMKIMNGKANDFTQHNIPINPGDPVITLINIMQQPPEKVNLQADLWNMTGYPEWQWDRPAGADLFRYQLDYEPWIETQQLKFVPVTPLPEGSHFLTVQCKSIYSVWSEESTLKVIVDTTKPDISELTYEPQAHSQNAGFSWIASDNYTVSSELQYEITIDDQPGMVIDTPEYRLLNILYEGSHNFTVIAIDRAGNKSDAVTREFEIDQLTFIDSIYTIEPGFYPFHYFQIQNNNIVNISTINTQSEYINSRFQIQNSIISGENQIVFESVNHPGFYLRKRGTGLVVSSKSVYDNDPVQDPSFPEDITFIIQPGLGDHDGFSLESYSIPGFYVKCNDLSTIILDPVNPLDPQDCSRATLYLTKKGNNLDLTDINTFAEFEALTKYNLDLNLPVDTTGKRYIGDTENADSHLFVKSCYDFPYYHGYEAVAGDDQGDYRIVIWKGDYDLRNDGTFINNTAAFFWSIFTQNQNKDDVGYFGSGAEICVYKKKTYKIRNAEQLLMLLPLEEGLTFLENLKDELLDALGNIDVDFNDYIDDSIFENFPEVNSDLDQFIFQYRELFKVADYDLMQQIPNLMHGFEFRLDPSPNRIIQRIGEYLSDSDNMSNFLYEFIWVYAGNPIPAINNIIKELRDEYPEDFEYTHYMPYSLSNFSETDPPLMRVFMVSKVDTVIDGDVIKKGEVIVADTLRTWWLNCWTGKDGHGQELQWDEVVLYFRIEGFYNDQWQRWDHDEQEGGWGSLTDFLYIDL